MNKTEYITRLAKALEPYEIPNKYEILADYEQIVDEILLDNDNDFNNVIEKLGYPEILSMEIADELGYEIKIKNKQFKEDGANRYDNKRQKSNVIWNIIMVFFYLVQTGLTIAFVTLISFILYFGVSSNLDIEINEKAVDDTQVVLKFCRQNTECKTYKTSFSADYYSHNRFYKENHFKENRISDFDSETMTTHINISVGFISILAATIIGIMMFINYFTVFKNVRKIINDNNEYNRRRNYD